MSRAHPIARAGALALLVALASLFLPACAEDAAEPTSSGGPAAEEAVDRWSAAMSDADTIRFEATQTREWLRRDGTINDDDTEVYRFRGALDQANGAGRVTVRRTLFGRTQLMWEVRWDRDNIWASYQSGAWRRYRGDYWAESFAAGDIRDPAAWGLARSPRWPGTSELVPTAADDAEQARHLRLTLDAGALFDQVNGELIDYRPEGVDQAQWQKEVETLRNEYVTELRGQAGCSIDETSGRLIQLRAVLEDTVGDDPPRTQVTTVVRALAYDEPVAFAPPASAHASGGGGVPPLTFLMEIVDDLGTWGLRGHPW